MDVFAIFGNIFSGILSLMSRPINLGNGISVTFFGVFIGISILGLLIAVVRRLYD